jgi:hypothetical protein
VGRSLDPGGAYAILYTHDDGSQEIVEFDAADREIRRTYSAPPRSTSRTDVDRVDSSLPTAHCSRAGGGRLGTVLGRAGRAFLKRF